MNYSARGGIGGGGSAIESLNVMETSGDSLMSTGNSPMKQNIHGVA